MENPFYVLVASDVEDEHGRRISGFDVWQRRFQTGLWPIYERTPNAKAISRDDRILFYVGGTGAVRQSFVGQAVVDQIIGWTHHKGEVDADSWITTPATAALIMSEPKRFQLPIKVTSLLDKLECAPANKSKWGVIFHGGIRKFSAADASLVLRAAKSV